MNAIINNARGSIVISREVLAKISGYSATSCYGVVGMCLKSSRDGVAKLLGVESYGRGIKIKIKENVLYIDVFIIAEYGTNVNTIGDSVIHSVKYNVEQLTGVKVDIVNVHIESLRVD